MKEYTPKQIKELKANPYTYKVTKNQGCHYTSGSFIQLVKDKGLRQSMSRKGNCWDNAPQESFFGRMKDHVGERRYVSDRRCESYIVE